SQPKIVADPSPVVPRRPYGHTNQPSFHYLPTAHAVKQTKHTSLLGAGHQTHPSLGPRDRATIPSATRCPIVSQQQSRANTNTNLGPFYTHKSETFLKAEKFGLPSGFAPRPHESEQRMNPAGSLPPSSRQGRDTSINVADISWRSDTSQALA
ncbi:hypothetical protein RRG08_052024, partial [Elysia crispata]